MATDVLELGEFFDVRDMAAKAREAASMFDGGEAVGGEEATTLLILNAGLRTSSPENTRQKSRKVAPKVRTRLTLGLFSQTKSLTPTSASPMRATRPSMRRIMFLRCSRSRLKRTTSLLSSQPTCSPLSIGST